MKSFNLVFSQKYENLKNAGKVESRLKKLKRHNYIDNIVKDGFIRIKP